jgi:L-fuculose-phosphate aldolase
MSEPERSDELTSRQRLIETALEMNRAGINSGTSGNVSVRLGQGMLITPSGIPYGDLQAQDIVRVEADGRAVGGKPSSEWRFHHDIYRSKPEAGAVVHTHPRHCTALACLHKAIPAFHYMVAVAGGDDIPLAGYATFGSPELSSEVLQALQDRSACLMANHGLVCHGHDLSSALALACEVEHLASMYLDCLSVGEPELLDAAEMRRVLEKFRDYGPPR